MMNIHSKRPDSMFAGISLKRRSREHLRSHPIQTAFIYISLTLCALLFLIPYYIIVSEFGWVSTLQGIIVPQLFSSCGFACFLFRQSYLNFPRELEDAGRIDGLGYFGIYWRLLLPNSIPILVAVGVISFIGSWNSFLWPLVIGEDPSSWKVQVVVSSFITIQTINIPDLVMSVACGVGPPL